MTTKQRVALNRQLLREAAAHLNTLADEAKLTYIRSHGQRGASMTARKFYERYAKLARLAQGVQEEADA